MTRAIAMVSAVFLATVWMLPEVQASQDCSGLSGCGYDKVAVIRCDTELDGSIKVRNSSVTTAAGVTVQKGDRCAATVSALLQAGLKMSHGPRVTAGSMSAEVSLNFVFVGGDSSDDDDDDDDDDDE